MTDGDEDPDAAGARVRRTRRDLDEGRTLCLHIGAEPTAEAMRVAEKIALNLLGVLQEQTGSPVLRRMLNAAHHAPPGQPKTYDDSAYMAEIESLRADNPGMSFNRAATLVASSLATTERELKSTVERFRVASKKRKVST
ncbi:MAG: hypothetical protein K0M55_15805 [Rhizobium sp.]|nr:hypothetical protein [Rhizobium sp.]MBW8319262.1 hypothetical protein [Rhizobium sp.]